jgi:hypothetical protein
MHGRIVKSDDVINQLAIVHEYFAGNPIEWSEMGTGLLLWVLGQQHRVPLSYNGYFRIWSY